MDTYFQAVSLFRRRNYDQCIEACNLLLVQQQQMQREIIITTKNALHQGRVWELKMRAMTQRVYVDENEADDGISADEILDIMPATAKPSTSIATGMQRAVSGRPKTSVTGRPITGISRPGSKNEKPITSRLGNKTARLSTASNQRLNSAQNIRLGSASMYAYGDPLGPLIHLSRFHAAQYADKISMNKPLFQYLYYHEGDIQKALQLCDAVIDLQKTSAGWWWYAQKGRCFLTLKQHRSAEEYMKLSLQQMPHPDTILLLSRLYMKMKRSEHALLVLQAALTDKFPGDISLMTQQARIQEHIGNINHSVHIYRNIALLDSMNTEALACIAVHYFYNNQPETALLYYRRILSMGAHSAELYCNIALCCLYGGQLDLVLYCFQRSIRLAITHEQKADVWYNISFVALTTSDINLARRCLRLCISYDGSYGAALNNLAVLAARAGQFGKVKSYLLAAQTAAPECEEINNNIQLIEKYK